MYSSPDETLKALEEVGYFTDLKTATTVYLAGRIHRPIMLEGPAGAGKTELASSVARAYRVRCFYDRMVMRLAVRLRRCMAAMLAFFALLVS